MENRRWSPARITVTVLCGIVAAILVAALLLIGLFEMMISTEVIGEYPSSDGRHTLEVILFDGGATTPWSICCDVKGEDIRGKRRLYVQDHCNEAVVRWIDSHTVEINGVRLDIAREEIYHDAGEELP